MPAPAGLELEASPQPPKNQKAVTSNGTTTPEEPNARRIRGVKPLFLPSASLKRNLEGILGCWKSVFRSHKTLYIAFLFLFIPHMWWLIPDRWYMRRKARLYEAMRHFA
jgi:hypothetical protein